MLSVTYQHHGFFFVRDTRPICYFHDNHGGDGRTSLWYPASVGVQDELVGSDPERFFRPPTSARGTFSNWVGVYLDTVTDDADWTEIGAIIEEAFRLVAPQSIIAKLDRRRLLDALLERRRSERRTRSQRAVGSGSVNS